MNPQTSTKSALTAKESASCGNLFERDSEYGELIKRIRRGKVTTEDTEKINSRVVGITEFTPFGKLFQQYSCNSITNLR